MLPRRRSGPSGWFVVAYHWLRVLCRTFVVASVMLSVACRSFVVASRRPSVTGWSEFRSLRHHMDRPSVVCGSVPSDAARQAQEGNAGGEALS